MLIALDEKPHSTTSDTFAVHSFSPHPQCCEPQTLFTQGPYNRQILRRTPDAIHKERNSLTFFNFLYMVRIVSLRSHHQITGSYPVKNSSTFNISPICCHQPTKTVLLQQRQVLSHEFEKLGDFFSQIFHVLHQLNAAGHSCFSLRGSNPRENLTSAQDFFVFKQPIKKIEINSKILCPQSPSILVPRLRRLRDEKRAMGTSMTSVSLTSLPSTLLHSVRGSVENCPSTDHFYFTWLGQMYESSITIYLLI